MNCYAFQVINQEAVKYCEMLKQSAVLTARNVISLQSAKMEIEAMLRGAA